MLCAVPTRDCPHLSQLPVLPGIGVPDDKGERD